MYMYSPSLSLSFSLSDFKSSHFPVVTTLSKQLLSHAFKLLPNCRSQFSLSLFRVILCLCAPGEGEESVLCESDVSLLKNIVCNNLTSLEKLLQEKKQGLYIINIRSWASQYIFSIFFVHFSIFVCFTFICTCTCDHVLFLCMSVYSCAFQYILVSLDASDVTVSDKTRATPPTEGGGGGGHYEVQRLLSQMKTGSKKPSPLHFEGPQQVKSPKEGTVAIATVATVTTIFFFLIEFQGECV